MEDRVVQMTTLLIVFGLSGQLEADDRYGAGPPWSSEAEGEPTGAPSPGANRSPSATAPAGSGRSALPGNSSLSVQSSNPAAASPPGGVYRSETTTPRQPPPRDERRLAPEAAAASSAKPSTLIERLHQTPSTGKLAGVALSLAEAVQGSSSRREQTRRVVAYWDLSTAVADYYLALREGIEMDALKASVARPGPEWDEALDKLDVRTQAARRSAQAAQYQMQRMLGQAAAERLPLPSDLTPGGRYETRY